MMPPIFAWVFGIAGIWVAAFVTHLLPSGWMTEWYGLPTFLTAGCSVIGLVVLGLWVGCLIEDRLENHYGKRS